MDGKHLPIHFHFALPGRRHGERMTENRIVIVGSRGRMGAMLLQRFSEKGYDASGIDIPYSEEGLAACRDARAILLCIPADAIAKTVERLLPYMDEGTILADITSVKELPMQAMERLWHGPVVGTHPLFGPVQAPGLELRTTICPGIAASEADTAFIEHLYQSIGCITFRATPEEHDIAEAKIQGMNFITSAVYFALTSGDPSLLPYVTPSFLRRMNSTEKQLMEDGPLFTWLFEANPHSQSMVRQFRNMLSLAAAGDIELILSKAQWWWQDTQELEKTHEEARKVAAQSALASITKGNR